MSEISTVTSLPLLGSPAAQRSDPALRLCDLPGVSSGQFVRTSPLLYCKQLRTVWTWLKMKITWNTHCWDTVETT